MSLAPIEKSRQNDEKTRQMKCGQFRMRKVEKSCQNDGMIQNTEKTRQMECGQFRMRKTGKCEWKILIVGAIHLR